MRFLTLEAFARVMFVITLPLSYTMMFLSVWVATRSLWSLLVFLPLIGYVLWQDHKRTQAQIRVKREKKYWNVRKIVDAYVELLKKQMEVRKRELEN